MPHTLLGRARRDLSLLAAAALVAGSSIAVGPPPVVAASPNVVISQVYGGGGNSGGVYTNDFIELFNRSTATVSLAGWSLQYTSATGTGSLGGNDNQLTPLLGSLAPGQYLLVQEAAGSSVYAALPTPDITDSTPINMSGTGGKVALVASATGLGCNGGSAPCSAEQLALIKDLVGWGSANFYEGAAAAPATANSTAALRNDGGCVDTDNNSSDFTVGTPNPRNSASPAHECTGPTDPSGVGAADPNSFLTPADVLLTVAVTPGANPTSTGLAVTADLTAIGGAVDQAFYDDATHGDATAGDMTFSFLASVPASAAGSIALPVTITDAEGRTGSTTISLTALEILPIGTVNGAVGDTDDGTTHASPYAGQTVTVQGVVYEKTLQATSSGGESHGFFIQNTAATADGDPTTSDGMFVYIGYYSTLRVMGGGYYTPTVGDEIVLTGPISEYYNMTELGNPYLLQIVRTGVDIDGEVPPVAADPPADLAAANRYWERLQGMRVQVPEGSIVLGGRNVFSPADAEVWVAAPDSTIAQRTVPYTDRAFRDAHPLDDNYNPDVWDGNGYRILMGSLGIKATESDSQALIAPGRTFDTVTNEPAGGLNYTYSKYRIEISDQPTFSEGPDPSQNSPPQVIDRATQYSIVDYNLENLYDYRDNPFSGCDFNGGDNDGCSNVGTPFLASITPSYNYVPENDGAYQARLNDIALQIINDLHSPDVLMLQEVENQDICSLVGGVMDCDLTSGNPDGKPDVLQDLALRIAADGGPAYDAAFDPDSSDLRGIVPAFMYRTDRVELLPPTGDPVLGADPAIGDYTSVPYDSDVSNPKTLNAVLPAGIPACETSWVFPRAPDIGLFRIWSSSVGAGTFRDVYLIDNHFKSGPDSCVAHRTEQAKYDAALVAYIEAAEPNARVVVGGDLNVYPRPDDPFAPIGQPGSSDQLGALYNPSLGLTNLYDVLLAQAPEADYSYVYVGMAQTLDQMFVNAPMLADLDQFRVAHINSDFPADYSGDVARGTSDHDPNVATFGMPYFGALLPPLDNSPTVTTAKAGSTIPIKFSLGGNQGLDILAAGYPVSQEIDCETGAPTGSAEATDSTAGLRYDPKSDQYVYTWKTDKDWAGTCRVLTVELADGTGRQAEVSFQK